LPKYHAQISDFCPFALPCEQAQTQQHYEFAISEHGQHASVQPLRWCNPLGPRAISFAIEFDRGRFRLAPALDRLAKFDIGRALGPMITDKFE
jgi:hypothetical protein